MMNDDLDDVLSRIALHVENDVAEAEPTMFDDADVVFSRKLKRLKMWGWPEQYCKLKLPFASVEDVDAERKAGMLRAWLLGMAGKGMLAVVLGLRGTGKTLSACKLAHGISAGMACTGRGWRRLGWEAVLSVILPYR